MRWNYWLTPKLKKIISLNEVIEKFDVARFLNNNVRPAIGCTEPIAVAFASSVAYSAIFNQLPYLDKDHQIHFSNATSLPKIDPTQVKSIEIKTDRDVYKNSWAVNIPNTNGQKGMQIAAVLGIFALPYHKFNILKNIDKDDIFAAKLIMDSGKVMVNKVTDSGEKSALHIEVKVTYEINGKNRSATVIIENDHEHISRIMLDDRVVFNNPPKKTVSFIDKIPETLEAMLAILDQLPPNIINELYRGIEMNLLMADQGLKEDYGLKYGRLLAGSPNQKYSVADILNKNLPLQDKVEIIAGAAGDARMGGAPFPVMSTAGSGNQGITALIPVAVAGIATNKSKEQIAKAALLSHFVTKLCAEYSGYLSALCGCAIKAGLGASAAVTYLLGGTIDQISKAMNLTAANITGIICDGAKEGCAMKLATAARASTVSALAALDGVKVASNNGIIHENAIDTIKYALEPISKNMVALDTAIVNIMQRKGGTKGICSDCSNCGACKL